MLSSLRGRFALILIVVAISGWQLYSKGLKQGLDLQGGMHLVLEVDDPDGTLTTAARADAIDRAEKEAADARTYAATAFARDLLSVADNLARGLEAIPAELREDEKLKNLITGLEATGRELESVFQRHGIKKMSTLGETLDPNFHQAMFELPSDKPVGTIVQEMQAGYMIKDRLLRPALVGVAKKAD